MSRILPIGTLAFICLLAFSSICVAQKSTVNKHDLSASGNTATATPSKGTDLRPVLAKMRTQNKLVQGKNLVLDAKAQSNTPAIKLFATIDKGKVAKWQAVDADGKNLPTSTNRVMQAATIDCLVCVKLPNGTSDCYHIDCKDLPKPKENTQ